MHLSVFRLDVLCHTCASEVVIIVCQPDCVCCLSLLYVHTYTSIISGHFCVFLRSVSTVRV